MIKTEEFHEHLIQTTLSDKSIRAYMNGIKDYAQYFSELTASDVKEYRDRCLRKQKPATVNLRLNALRKYAKWQNIDIAIALVDIQEPLFADNPLSLTDYNKLLRYLIETNQLNWYVIFRTLACTGVRINESYQITVGDIRYGRKEILGKGTKTRTIWFPKRFRIEVLQLLKYKDRSDPVVCFTEDYIRTKLRNLQAKLGIKGHLSPHEFRRFYARQIYSKTKDIHLVKDLLGHASIKTTMHYLKISISSISRRMSLLVDG